MTWVLEACFNPTLVRLRPSVALPSPGAGGLFQSHAGSIEARQLATERSHPARGFNPTLVRLRRGCRMDTMRSSTCFNPTLVRLRPRTAPGAFAGPAPFQSHAGSIEAGPAGGRG